MSMLPSLSTSPTAKPMLPKSAGRSARACSENVPSRLFTSSTPSPNSLMTCRSGQPSLSASSQAAVNVERCPRQVQVAPAGVIREALTPLVAVDTAPQEQVLPAVAVDVHPRDRVKPRQLLRQAAADRHV